VCPSSTITLVSVIAPPNEVLGLPGSEPFVGRARVAAEATPARQGKDFQETCFNRIPISRSPTLPACALFQLPDALPRDAKFIANFLQRGHVAVQPEAAGQDKEVPAPSPEALKAGAHRVDHSVACVSDSVFPEVSDLLCARAKSFEQDAESSVLTIHRGQQTVHRGHSLP
jgi:hypothetical protein